MPKLSKISERYIQEFGDWEYDLALAEKQPGNINFQIKQRNEAKGRLSRRIARLERDSSELRKIRKEAK